MLDAGIQPPKKARARDVPPEIKVVPGLSSPPPGISDKNLQIGSASFPMRRAVRPELVIKNNVL